MRQFILSILSLLSIVTLVASDSPRPWSPGQTCPTDIRTLVPQSKVFPTMQSVHDALMTCPNIKSLHLRVTSLGCSEHPDRSNFPLSPVSKEKYLPSLESLSLEGYRFEDKPWKEVEDNVNGPALLSLEGVELGGGGWGSALFLNMEVWMDRWFWRLSNLMRWRQYSELSVAERNQTNLDLLLQSMDFSQLRDLTIKDSCWRAPGEAKMERWAEALPSLQSLSISGTWDCDVIRSTEVVQTYVPDFISALPSDGLTNLTWVNGGTCDPEILNAMLDHHGPTLKSLEWRNDELLWRNRSAFTTEDLQTLSKRAPNLQSLAIDLNQDEEWPIAELEAIAEGMPNLTDLTVYLRMTSDLGWAANEASYSRYNSKMMREYEELYEGKDLRPSMRLWPPHAEKLFETLRVSKVGSPFKAVHLRSGDWTRPWDGPMTFGDGIFEQAKEWYACSDLRPDGTPKSTDEPLCLDEIASRGDDFFFGNY